jgi:hypothetical protein
MAFHGVGPNRSKVPDLPRRTRTRGPGGMQYLTEGGGRFDAHQFMGHMMGARGAARKGINTVAVSLARRG